VFYYIYDWILVTSEASKLSLSTSSLEVMLTNYSSLQPQLINLVKILRDEANNSKR